MTDEDDCHLKKTVIIGSPGAGKTTLAQTLGRILNIRVIHLDRLFWKRGWQALSRDERIDILQDLVPDTRWPDGRWIMEGTYLQSSEPRLEAADTTIFLDIHPLICLGRVIKRHYEYYGQVRRDLPEEAVDRLTFSRIWKVLIFPLKDRKELKQNLKTYKSKEIIWLRSSEEVENFLVEMMKSQDTDAKILSSRMISTSQRST